MYNAFSLKKLAIKGINCIKQHFRCICSLPGYGCSANSVVILVDSISHLAFFVFVCLWFTTVCCLNDWYIMLSFIVIKVQHKKGQSQNLVWDLGYW